MPGYDLQVLFTLYPRMTPFFCDWGRADHMSRILLELTASAVTFTGDPDGTSEHTEKHTHTHTAQCYFTLWTNLRFYLNHLLLPLSINLNLAETEGECRGHREVAGWEETWGGNGSTLFLIHLPSYTQQIQYLTEISAGHLQRWKMDQWGLYSYQILWSVLRQFDSTVLVL